jgi:PPP family 3-phenylpropionic acid transporter
VGRAPYWQLSGFYFFFFATLGALLPYWPLYLKSLGFTPVHIGGLMAVVMATKIIAPNVWGWLADVRGRRMDMVRVAAFVATATFAVIPFAESFLWIALLMVLFSFFWNAALPQFEAVTLNHLGEAADRYTRIRLWGSVGFIVAVLALGALVNRFGAGVVPFGVLLPMAGIAMASLLVAEVPRPAETGERSSIIGVLSHPPVAAFLVACLLMQASHGPYYVFFSIYLQEHGYPAPAIGALWALGVLAEVVAFLVMPRFVHRVGLRPLFLLALGLTAGRWVMVAFLVESPVAMVLAQLLHAASFGLYHGVAIQLVHRYFVGPHQGRGQALYSSISFGAGGALGSLLAGYAWVGLGTTNTWLGAAVLAALAWVVSWCWVAPERPSFDESRFQV